MLRLLWPTAVVVLVVAAVAAVGASGTATRTESAQVRWVLQDLGPTSRRLYLSERGEVAGTALLKDGGYTVERAVVWQDGRRRQLGFLRSLGCGRDMPGVSYATGINDSGLVVGQSYCDAMTKSYVPFLWQNGKMISFTGSGSGGGATEGEVTGPAINNRGQIAGGYSLWQNGRWSDLGRLPGRPYTYVVAVNERGAVVGDGYPRTDEYEFPVGATHGFVSSNGKMTDLGTLGGKSSVASAINENGQIVGQSATRAGRQHAFLWQQGRMIDLGTLGGKSSRAVAINENGQIVGWSDTTFGGMHGFLWQKGRMIDVGTLGGTRSDAQALNKRGQVVGWSETKTGPQHAFLWQNGRMTALPSPAGQDASAAAINDHGQIAGVSGGHAVLWTLRSGT